MEKEGGQEAINEANGNYTGSTLLARLAMWRSTKDSAKNEAV